jgi:hypothetical protein
MARVREIEEVADQLVVRLRAAAMANRYWRHSDGYRWLRARYSHLRAALPDWDAIAEQVAKEGFVGKRGQRLSGPALRWAWRRVCRDIESEAARKRRACSRRRGR